MQKAENERRQGSPSYDTQKDDDTTSFGLQPNVGLLRQLKLFVELGAIRKTEDKTALQYTSKIREIHKKLAKVGVMIPDHALALIMLRGLPMYRYEALVLRLARDEEKLSSMLVESRLNEEELRMKRDSDLAKMREDSGGPKIRGIDSNVRTASMKEDRNNSEENKIIRRVQSQKEDTRRACNNSNDRVPLGQKICRSCDDINLARHSPKFREERKTNQDSEKENKKAKMCTCDQFRNYWILDSGAAEHGTFDKEHMEDFEFIGGDICMANGTRLSVEGQGSVKLALEEECGGGNLILEGVRYIPELETNLISMGSLDECGMTLSIKDGKAEVQDDGKVVFTAHNEHNVFVIKTKGGRDVKPNRSGVSQVLTTGGRRFSNSDGNDLRTKTRNTFQSLWKY